MKIAQSLKLALKRVLSLALGEVETDKGILVFDGELAVGVEVFVAGEGDELVPAADGEYKAEGKTIVVADGKVAEIREDEKPAEEEAPAVEVEEEEDPNLEPAAEPAEEPENDPVNEPSVEDRLDAVEARIAEILEGLQSIVNAVAALEGRLVSVENKLSELEGEPAAEPAEEPAPEETEMKSKIQYLRKK